MPAAGNTPWNKRRLETKEWLRGRAPRLVGLYEGVIEIYESNLPGRIRFLAHGIREICNRLPDPWTTGDGKRVEYDALVSAILPHWEAANLPIGTGALPIKAANEGGHADARRVEISEEVAKKIAVLLGEHKSGTARNIDKALILFEGLSRDAGGALGHARLSAELWNSTRKWFVGLVHEPKNGVEVSLEDVARHFAVFEDMLYAMAAKYFDVRAEVEALMVKEPTPENIEALSKASARYNARIYFFERLQNPAWLGPLEANGTFRHPHRDQYWPEIVFLGHMARHAPSQVVSILKALPDFANPNIGHHIVRIALEVGTGLAKELVPGILAALEHESFAEANFNLLPQLIVTLARDGETENALRIANVFFGIRKIETGVLYEMPGGRLVKQVIPRPLINQSRYQEALNQCLNLLVEAAPEKALRMFCKKLLQACVAFSLYDEEKKIDLTGRLGREINGINSSFLDVGQLTASAVLEAAAFAILKANLNPSVVFEVLESFHCKIFKLLPIHILRWIAPRARDVAKVYLTSFEEWDSLEAPLAFGDLVQARFGELQEADRHRVLDMVHQGPDLPGYVAFRKGVDGIDLPEDQQIQYRDNWILTGLRRVPRAFLRPEDEALLVKLIAEQANASRISSQDQSPVGPKDLCKKAPEEVIAICKRYQPGGEMGAETMGSLALAFEIAVRERPTEYTEVAASAIGLNWAYLRSFLWAIANDVANGPMRVHWAPLLDLFHHMADELLRSDLQLDPAAIRNGASRKELLGAIAEILKNGYLNNRLRLEFALRERSWELIVKLMSAPDRWDEDEIGDLPDRLPYEVRSIAMRTVMEHMIWVWKWLGAIGADRTGGLEVMPEVKGMLIERLDVESEPLPGVRETYGTYFPWLIEIDAEWATAMIPSIFPTGNRQYLDAAWLGYLRKANVHIPVFAPLRPLYELAIKRLGEPANDEMQRDHDEQSLGHHLLTFYWEDVPESRPVLWSFMKKSSLMGRRNLFDLVERSLGNSPVGAPVDEKFIERVKALWQSRLDVAKASKKPEEFAYELAMFGGTMVNGNFDLDWALPFLLEVLKVGGYVEHSSQVIQMLAAVVAERTDMVTECLYLMVKDTPQGQAWRYLTSKDDLSKILVRALAAGPDTADKAVKAIHLIGERGCDDFVGLLNLGKGRS